MRRLVAVCFVLVGLLATAACEGRGRNTQTQNVSNPRPVHCTVIADGPKRDQEPARSIVARSRFRCDRPGAEALTLTLRLERQDGSAWRSVASQRFVMRGNQTHAEFFKYQNRRVTIGCGPGRFRTTVEWTRQSRGRSITGTTRSGGIADPCAPRLFT